MVKTDYRGVPRDDPEPRRGSRLPLALGSTMNLRCLSEAEQRRLHSIFPRIVELNEHEPSHGYEQLAISVFDHRLSGEEALLLLGQVPPEEQSRRNALLQTFMDSLLRETDVVTFHFSSDDPDDTALTFAGFTSAGAAREYFRHSGDQRYVAVCAAFRAVVYEGYDDTNHLFFLDRDQIGRPIELAKMAGLYVW